jgi:hypothetical protein
VERLCGHPEQKNAVRWSVSGRGRRRNPEPLDPRFHRFDPTFRASRWLRARDDVGIDSR